jgi:hypothetical protein
MKPEFRFRKCDKCGCPFVQHERDNVLAMPARAEAEGLPRLRTAVISTKCIALPFCT